MLTMVDSFYSLQKTHTHLSGRIKQTEIDFFTDRDQCMESQLWKHRPAHMPEM